MIEQPHLDRVRLLPWRIPDWVIDVSLISFVAVGFLVRRAVEDVTTGTAAWVGLGVAIVLLIARRRYPIPTLVFAVGSAAAAIAITDQPSVLLLVSLIALFNVAQQHTRRVALIAGAATTASFLLIITTLLEEGAIDGAGLAAIAWPAFAATAGVVVRSTRENVAASEERALRAEESRDIEAQRRVGEERLRIARDVHDLVAHHIAVINVQSGVAGHLIASDPDAAGQALDVVRDAASTALDQLGELLGVLRSPDDADDPTTPTPDLAAIDDLISSFASSGLSVQDERTGTPRPLTASAELAAYRVVQEALTNAHKHGNGTAAVALRFTDGGLEIAVSNQAADSVVHGNGFGLVGMRERVEAVGGTLDARLTDTGNRFDVAAMIPGKNQT